MNRIGYKGAKQSKPAADHKAAGSLARRAGRELEKAIEAVNGWYDQQGDALIEKVNPPTFGWGKTLGLGTSTVDYTGSWRRPEYIGRDGIRRNCQRLGIAFDAKSVTGKPRFGIEELVAGRKSNDAMKLRERFFKQVAYLRHARDRHGYAAFFLLYCAELDTMWLCDRLDDLSVSRSVEIRTITGRGDTRTVEHHLPNLTNPGNPISLLGLAAIPRVDTRRPHLDYLSLIP